MIKEDLKKLVDTNNSTREIAQHFQTSQTNVRYWLKKYNLTTLLKKERYVCACGENNKNNFYQTKKYICKKCHNKYTLNNGKEKRQKIIDLLGGKCIKCGYDKHLEALDLHHIDPTNKDVNFKSIRGWTWQRINDEIKKCVLLCKCCHVEEHLVT